jgi:hypothetical protein
MIEQNLSFFSLYKRLESGDQRYILGYIRGSLDFNEAVQAAALAIKPDIIKGFIKTLDVRTAAKSSSCTQLNAEQYLEKFNLHRFRALSPRAKTLIAGPIRRVYCRCTQQNFPEEEADTAHVGWMMKFLPSHG